MITPTFINTCNALLLINALRNLQLDVGISLHCNPGLTTGAISKHNFNPVHWAVNPKLQLNHNNTEPQLCTISYNTLYSPSAVGASNPIIWKCIDWWEILWLHLCLKYTIMLFLLPHYIQPFRILILCVYFSPQDSFPNIYQT